MKRGLPVTISTNGLGMPVTPVTKGAPLASVSDNGRGQPIVWADNGVPLVIEQYPYTLFSKGQPGFWAGGFDPAAGRVYQDSAGTIPVVAITDPIGRIVRAAGTVDAIQAAPGDRPTLRQWPSGAWYLDGEAAGKELFVVLPAGNYDVAIVSPTGITEFDTLNSDGTTQINIFLEEWQSDIIIRDEPFTPAEKGRIVQYWAAKYDPQGQYLPGTYGLAATFAGEVLRIGSDFGTGPEGLSGDF